MDVEEDTVAKRKNTKSMKMVIGKRRNTFLWLDNWHSLGMNFDAKCCLCEEENESID